MVFAINRSQSGEIAQKQPQPSNQASSLVNTLKIAQEHARRLTQMYGPEAPEVAVAWDVVEELLTAQRRQQGTTVTAFGTYCERHPEARECRVYEI